MTKQSMMHGTQVWVLQHIFVETSNFWSPYNMLNYKILPYLFFGETGGTKRDVLLKDFVCRCYSPNDDFAKNKVLPSHVYNNCFNQVDTPNPSRSSCHAMSGQVAGTHHSEEQCQILATKLARLFMAYRGRDEVEAGLGRAPCLH